jgi:hypothetical protein
MAGAIDEHAEGRNAERSFGNAAVGLKRGNFRSADRSDSVRPPDIDARRKSRERNSRGIGTRQKDDRRAVAAGCCEGTRVRNGCIELDARGAHRERVRRPR